MAKSTVDVGALSRNLIEDARKGVFKPVYLLMGDEPFYPDQVCQAVLDNCVDESFKDFNEIVCFGADVTAEKVISAARQYPMMSERLLVVVKEAQMMKDIETLALYCEAPLDSTVLVLLLHGASVNRTKSLYKRVQKVGVVVDSPALRDYEIARWISSYYQSRGLQIEPQAAALLGEYAGTDLSTIAVETDKLLKSLPEGTVRVTVSDIENNVGISREYSIFELSKELTLRNPAKALRIASHIGTSARFAMPMAVSALYTQFYRILKYGALLMKNPYPDDEEKRKVLGVSSYFFREYDAAVRNYPVKKAMAVVSLLCEYDYLGKGGDGGTLPADELLTELCLKILNI